MKSFVRTPILIVAFLLSALGIIRAESDSLYLDVLNIQPSKFLLTFNGSDSETKLRILDSAERLLWEDSFDGQMKKIYNFDQLPNGEYQVILEDEGNRIIQPLVKKEDRAIMESNAQLRIEYPNIEQRNNNEVLIDMTRYAFSRKSRIVFEDLDQEYQEEFTLKDGKINLFKLSKLPEGQYEVKLLVGDKIINRSIIL